MGLRNAQTRGLLDTSTVILLGGLADATVLPDEGPHQCGNARGVVRWALITEGEERSPRRAHLQQAETDFAPLPFDAAAARAFGRVAGSLRRAGRKTSARAYDAMIAATALANGLPLYTCNPATSLTSTGWT